MEYCYLCDEYPCEKYDGIDAFDSFITHRNQLKDVKKAREIGMDAYQAELAEKMEILKYLLANYNDGRRKSFFCLAVNLLELPDLKLVIDQITSETGSDQLSLKDKAKLAASRFNTLAEKQNIVLKLNRKPKR